MNLKGRDFLTLKDFTPEEIAYLLDLSAELKEKKKKGIPVDTLRGKNVALIFEKTSTRTRCSFEVAAHDLGMGTTYLDPTGSQIGKKESIKDTARVLAGMYEGIEYRGFGQEIVEELAKYSKVPVWNGLTNEYHPTQMLADMLTIQEEFGHLKGIKFVYMGDARYNMGNSLMIASAKMGMDFVACAPKKYFPNAELVAQCEEYAKESGATITLTEDVKEGTKDADVIYTDVWVSMGEPDSVWEERIHDLTPYRVTKEAMRGEEPRQSKIDKVHNDEQVINHLEPMITEYLVKISHLAITEKEMKVVNNLFDSITDIERSGDHVENMAGYLQHIKDMKESISEDAAYELRNMNNLVKSAFESAIRAIEFDDTKEAKETLSYAADVYYTRKTIRKRHIQRMKDGECSPDVGVYFLDIISSMERIAGYAFTIARYILSQNDEEE